MTTWVTGAAILVGSGAYQDPATASAADVDWSTLCANAVNAGMDLRLAGATVTGTEPELVRSALRAGVDAYKAREAGLGGGTGYVDLQNLQGPPTHVARDYLESQAPIIARYATRGIG